MITGARELAEQFKAEATRAGAVVYEAKDAEDAKDYVLRLAQEHKVKRIVKSKSKVADEIGLREHLESAGIGVRETGLGEWSAQLGVEVPAHAPDPAARKTLQQVAELISKATGEELEPAPQVLLNAARRALRQACIDADMGISGADIGIAETGTLVMVNDEGNARLVAVLPPIHVTLVDCEKLVATMDDATLTLESVIEKSTGPKMPSYVTYITGRNTTGDIPQALMARAQGLQGRTLISWRQV